MADDLERSLRARWRFLEAEKDACCVVTRRMEVVYLNEAARSLVPEPWFGSRCWEVFPVGEGACAGRCPAVRWVAASAADGYCEEVLSVHGRPLVLGVAVLLLQRRESPERSLLVLRPRGEEDPEGFRERLLADGRRLRARADGRARPEIDGSPGDGAPAAQEPPAQNVELPGDFPHSPDLADP